MTVSELPVTNQPVLCYSFTYDGTTRIVDNVTIERGSQTIVGMEIRKGAEATHKIKRYSLSKISNLVLIGGNDDKNSL